MSDVSCGFFVNLATPPAACHLNRIQLVAFVIVSLFVMAEPISLVTVLEPISLAKV